MTATAELRLSSRSSAQQMSLRWKASLDAQRAALQRHYIAGNSASELLRRHSLLIDRHLKAMWRYHEIPAELSLVAVGGYGRGQLFPYSDIDLMVLLPRAADDVLTQKLEQFISMLWDIGLPAAPSVRTIEECLQLSAQDVTIQTSLLEARSLIGDRKLFLRFEKQFMAALDPQQFNEAKRLEQEQRHAHARDTTLEPNIKESAGGLRDLHNILWISRAAGIGYSWAELVKAEIITAREATQLRQHELFLQNLRIRLHYLSGRREERLVFDVQTALAAQMGLVDTAHRRASEHLMQRYYRTAKYIRQINTVILQNLGALIYPAAADSAHTLNPRFGIRNELLEMRDDELFWREPSAMFEAIILLQQHHELKGMTAATLRALWRASRQINSEFRANPTNRAQFMEILRSPTRVLRALARMNQYGMLGRYIPAFGRIVGQLQHDLYHVHTVDVHILRVIRNLRRFAVPELAHEFPLCSRLMSDFGQPELLYVAGLFHDIGKGRGGDHSILGKADALDFCEAHGLNPTETELVTWLVENHLTMSLTAQKQDLADPAVIDAFATKVKDQRHLVALYLLTIADVRGTSPTVWNAWKGKLLEDLYFATNQRLTGNAPALGSSLQQRQEQAKELLRLSAISEQAPEKLWAQLDVSYFLRHDPDEIAWHTRVLNYRVDSDRPVVKARTSRTDGLSVMIYVRDQKDLFARICSFFERSNYSIMDAKIYTTRHGYALDSFQISDPLGTKKSAYRHVIGLIEYELGQRLARQTALEPPLQGRVSRQLRHFPITPEIRIEPDDRGVYKVLQIIAGDRPGLLSRVARCLVKYNISLHTAKINTLGDRAEDVFLIHGSALDDPKTVLRFESELLHELQA